MFLKLPFSLCVCARGFGEHRFGNLSQGRVLPYQVCFYMVGVGYTAQTRVPGGIRCMRRHIVCCPQSVTAPHLLAPDTKLKKQRNCCTCCVRVADYDT